MRNVIWEFKTANFTVRMTAEEEYDVDLSWDDTGEVAEKIGNGLFEVFAAKCAVYFHGAEVGVDYLGNCIYENYSDFRDHVGIAAKSRADNCNYGSYFSDMVREAVREARKAMCAAPRLRCA